MSEQQEVTQESRSDQQDMVISFELGGRPTWLRVKEEYRVPGGSEVDRVPEFMILGLDDFGIDHGRLLAELLSDLQGLPPASREVRDLVDLETTFSRLAPKTRPDIEDVDERCSAHLRWYRLSNTKTLMLQIKICTTFFQKGTDKQLLETECTAWAGSDSQPRSFPDGRGMENYREVQQDELLFASGQQLPDLTGSSANSRRQATLREGTVDEALTKVSTWFGLSLEQLSEAATRLLQQHSQTAGASSTGQ